jgi:DNA-binding transcriptional ArsR family regulator
MTQTVSANTIAAIAALIGDTTRANILIGLMDGRALTAGELAFRVNVSASTTSEHLARLTEAGLIAAEKQGRHRYFRLANGDIASVLESLMTLSIKGPTRHHPTGPKDAALRAARTCYDHLAGRLGVAIADALIARKFVVLAEGAGLVTDEGAAFLCDFGVGLDRPVSSKRPLCRTCLDWSERRPHLAGWLGAAILTHTLDLKWIVRLPDSRAMRVTETGRRGLAARFAITLD